VPQLNLYVSDSLARTLRAAARKAGKSLSAYVVQRLEGRPTRSAWPPGFLELAGTWEGPLAEPEDPPPDERTPL
jgi:hypothetical protein